MILCVGATPAAQRVMVFRKVQIDAVNRAVTTLDGAAGKSINVAKVLKALGEQPLATGFVGGARCEFIRQTLESRGIRCEFVVTPAPTRQCITVIDQSTNAITELVEESTAVAVDYYDRLFEIVRRHLSQCRAVVLSGSLTPGGPLDFHARCTQLAIENGIMAIVDAQGPPLAMALKARPSLIKPNRAELAATVGKNFDDDSAVFEAMRDVHAAGAERVVVTAGAHLTLALEADRLWRIQPPAIAAVNPIGSGDAFTAGLVWNWLQTRRFEEACRWGAAAGAANALTLMPGELEASDVPELARQVIVERST